MKSFDKLREIIASLRHPETGCPWDKAQTHETLTRYLVEECYEVIDAIENDPSSLPSELGDLLLQIMLHSQIGEESGSFTLEDVVTNISEKMIRRHPHIFADTSASTVEEVKQNWERIKKQEKGAENDPYLASVPKSFPALLESHEIGRKVAKVGFDWPNLTELKEKVREELIEFLDTDDEKEMREELGDLLFTMAQLSRALGNSPEQVLKSANQKFRKRFGRLEELCPDLEATNREELERLWQQVKSEEQQL